MLCLLLAAAETGWSQPPCGSMPPVGASNVGWVVITRKGEILASKDRLGWSNRAPGMSTFVRDVSFAQGLFVAVGGRKN